MHIEFSSTDLSATAKGQPTTEWSRITTQGIEQHTFHHSKTRSRIPTITGAIGIVVSVTALLGPAKVYEYLTNIRRRVVFDFWASFQIPAPAEKLQSSYQVCVATTTLRHLLLNAYADQSSDGDHPKMLEKPQQ